MFERIKKLFRRAPKSVRITPRGEPEHVCLRCEKCGLPSWKLRQVQAADKSWPQCIHCGGERVEVDR